VTTTEYLASIKERLLTDPLVARFHVRRERSTLTDGYLRAHLTLRDGSQLEFSEYVQVSPGDQIQVVTYSYHWSDTQGNLIRRWDNTPHFPRLPGFPNHVHEGAVGTVSPNRPVSIFIVLDEIASALANV
jgi:hypothetical protein